MISIRTRQLDAFHQAIRSDFEKTLARHLREFSPLHAGILGEEETLEAARLGIQRARARGFTGEGPIQLFLELMCLLGSEFDSDVMYPWVAAILGDNQPASQMVRADRLHAASVAYLDQVAGQDDVFTRNALQAIRAAGPGVLRDAAGDLTEQARAALHRIHPRKAEALGADRLRAVIQRGAWEAQARSISGRGGVWLIIVLQFAFGQGVARDPFLPWVGRTLNDTGTTDSNEKAKRLYQATMTYLERMLAGME